MKSFSVLQFLCYVTFRNPFSTKNGNFLKIFQFYLLTFSLYISCHLTLCVLRTYIYVLPEPCAQPLYIHLERIKDAYIRPWLLEKITRHGRGALKSYFTHYSYVVIVLFNTTLYRSVFSTISLFWAFCVFYFKSNVLNQYINCRPQGRQRLLSACVYIMRIYGRNLTKSAKLESLLTMSS